MEILPKLTHSLNFYFIFFHATIRAEQSACGSDWIHFGSTSVEPRQHLSALDFSDNFYFCSQHIYTDQSFPIPSADDDNVQKGKNRNRQPWLNSPLTEAAKCECVFSLLELSFSPHSNVAPVSRRCKTWLTHENQRRHSLWSFYSLKSSSVNARTWHLECPLVRLKYTFFFF